ncbi:transcription factor LHW [Hevea brasiliensis]|nr:transcription factor LHW [Hevea brasiliensis]
MGSVLKDTLKGICCSNGWSYGVFWRFDQRNSMLLTIEDAHCEEEMEAVVNNMLLQVHMIGEGIVGQAAMSGKCQWIFSDNSNGGRNSAGSSGIKDIHEDDSEVNCQFSSGLKTIAVIPVQSQGVIQFGSTQKILETPEFIIRIKRLFNEVGNINGLTSPENPTSSLNYENCDLNEWFTSFCNGNITPMHGGSCDELMEIAHTASINLTQSSGPTSDFQQEKMNPLCLDSSNLSSQLQTVGTEAQMILSSNPDTQFQHLSSQYAFSVEKSAAKTPCISTWSSEGSILTSLESQLPSEMRVQDSLNVSSRKENVPVFCGYSKQDFQRDSTVSSLYSSGGLINVEKTIQQNSARSMSNCHSASSYHAKKGGSLERETSLQKFAEEFKLDDFATNLSNCFAVDNLFEWFLSPSGHDITMNENLLQSAGITSVSSSLVGDVLLDIPFTQPTNSVQSSITDAFICDGQQKPVFLNDAGADMFNGLGLEYGCGQSGDCQENAIKLVVSSGHLAVSTGVSECVSELDVNPGVGHRKGLFSELGLEELISGGHNSNCITNSRSDDQLSTAKRRRLETSSFNHVQLGSVSCSVGSMAMQPTYCKGTTNNLLSKKEVSPKSQTGLWIDDSYSINNGGAILAKSKKLEEPTKATKKRARPGESIRPRPKDRQQIQDRIKELKGIIPDGGKCSIDALLDRTIKYMLFLQGVTKYADKLKQADEPKLIGEENKMVLKDNSTSGGGATWALEVGDQSMVCPIIVEDLSTPGLMLIEMLCEDRGFFLEIADVIRGFGLNILKGLMETREDKIWAHFIVEANTHITRIDILWSLVQLLQLTSISGMDSTNQPSNVMNGKVALLNNCQQPALPCPINLAETLQ